jgi:hypothetical protein
VSEKESEKESKKEGKKEREYYLKGMTTGALAPFNYLVCYTRPEVFISEEHTNFLCLSCSLKF